MREQVDQLREFVDLKMNKDDVKQGLDTKPDRAELELRIKELSSLMKRSIKKAVAASGDEDGTGALSTQQMSTAPGGTKKNPMYADLVWKKGGAPLAPHVPVAQLVAPSFGGGFNLGSMNMARPGDTAPPLRPGRHGQAAGTDLLPMMPREQDMPAHNPSNNPVVGVDGLITTAARPRPRPGEDDECEWAGDIVPSNRAVVVPRLVCRSCTVCWLGKCVCVCTWRR